MRYTDIQRRLHRLEVLQRGMAHQEVAEEAAERTVEDAERLTEEEVFAEAWWTMRKHDFWLRFQAFGQCRADFLCPEPHYWQRIAERIGELCQREERFICLLLPAEVEQAIAWLEADELWVEPYVFWPNRFWKGQVRGRCGYSEVPGVNEFSDLLERAIEQYCGQIHPAEPLGTDAASILAWLYELRDAYELS
jgi:hypothetical protein